MLLSSPGTLVAQRFVIEQLAGSGGMGSVYRARDLVSGAPIALKVLHVGSPNDDEAQRFSREARVLSSLEHPGIVRYVAHGQTPDGLPFIAMEWLQGCDLEQHLADNSLSHNESVTLVRQVAEALSVAHRRGIVHRDIKPSNLFLRDGQIERVTLLDFGVARDSKLTRAVTRTGVVVGTPGYMAPEQARGQTMLTPAADIFSLGCVFYECLAGRPPFDGQHLEAILIKILFEPEPPLRSLRPEASEQLETLLHDMLRKDPVARIPNAMALLESLAQLQSPTPSRDHWKPIAPESAALSLTTGEQQLFSVLLARSDEQVALQSTLNPRQVEEIQQRVNGIRETLIELNVRTEVLADGTLVGSLSSGREAVATDQAQRAAKSALLIHQRFPNAIISLATGRGVLDGHLPLGEAIGRAVQIAYAPEVERRQSVGAAAMMDAVTAGLLDGRLRTAPLGNDIFALLRDQAEIDQTRRLLGKPTPCVGREPELGLLETVLTTCIEETTPRALLVVAPPGTGKTRLRHEFLRRVGARGDGLMVLLARADLLGTTLPFGLLRQALLSLCGIQQSDPAAVQQQKLRQRFGERLGREEREFAIGFLGELCGVPFPSDRHAHLRAARQEPRMMEEGIRHSFLTWLRAECLTRPVLLVLEDLHWADPASIWLVDTALRDLSECALFVLGLARPEVTQHFPRLWAERVQTVPLRPLSRRASEQLVRQVLGSQASSEKTARIVEHAAGNALYLEELIRAAAEGKEAELPQTVLAMLQARIAGLESGARRALRAASIFGETVWSGAVATLLATERTESVRWLEHLTHEELLDQRTESRFAGETEYRFRHALLRDAAYSLLSDEDRLLGHRLAITFLEKAGESAAVLAYHAQAGGDRQQLVTYSLRAGDDAARLGQTTEERRYYESARQTLRALPETAEARRLHVDILLRQVDTGLTHDATEVQMNRLDEARLLLDGLGRDTAVDATDRQRRMRVDYLCGATHHYGGRPVEANLYFEKVAPLAKLHGELRLFAHTAVAIGASQCILGRFGAGRELLQDAAKLIESEDDQPEWLRCAGYLLWALAGSGRGRQRAIESERAERLALKLNRAPIIVRLRIFQAISLLLMGDWPGALSLAELALEMNKPLGDALFQFSAWDIIAWAEAHLAKSQQSLTVRADARRLRQSFGGGVLWDWLEAAEAEMLLLNGNTTEALRQAQAVSARSQAGEMLFSYVLAERIYALALHRMGGALPDVELRLGAALTVAEANEQVVHAAQIELTWATILRERGSAAAASPHLSRAIARFESAGCDYALAEARRLAAGS